MSIRRFFIFILVLAGLFDISLFLDKNAGFFNGRAAAVFDRALHAAGKKVDLGDVLAVSDSVMSVNQGLLKKTSSKKTKEPVELEIFRKCYPDVTFESEYDENQKDYLVKIKAPVFYGKDAVKEIKLWWADGRFLPESELKNKEQYWKLIYPYSKLKDPASLTKEEIEKIREFTAKENRRTTDGTPMFFYDFLYAAKSQIIIEDHIVHTRFLGLKTKIHERIKNVIFDIENQIYREAQKDKEIKDFIESLKSADAYNWRVIDGTGGRKSFHSYGIAIDILPKKLKGKAIFWNWTRDKDPENWMLTPIEKRWNPPQKVIDIFEEHGFIWGGNWIIFDNMHFEYHPEVLYNRAD